MSGYCQANNDTDGLSCDAFKTYRIDEKGTLEVTSIYYYHNKNYDETLREDIKLSFSTRFYSPTKEEIYNISVSCPSADPDLKYSKPPLEQYQYYYETSFGDSVGIFKSECYLNIIGINIGEQELPPETLLKIKIKLIMNNVSKKFEDHYEIKFSPKDHELPDYHKIKEYNSFNLRVDLPNNPYYTSYFLDSNIPPTMIAPKGTGESLFWDYCPQTDVVISYRLVENPIPKKIDGLIEKTYIVMQEAEKSSRISLFLGVTSIVITVITVIIPQRKKIASYILNKLRKVWYIIKNLKPT
jgi:hypothetical protein